jgi:hypothetical protein
VPSIDVIYARNLKPGDLYAGTVDRDAPTRPVQPFAWSHEVRKVSLYTDDQGNDMVLITGPNGDLSPVPIITQVMVIRL